jgi:uncharacterized GH25 family protein
MNRTARRIALAVLCAAGSAQAHDSWLAPSRDDAPPGQAVLELATGTRYPVQQFGQSIGSVAQSGCIGSDGGALALQPLREHEQWLDLAVTSRPGQAAPVACWVELGAVETELEAKVVDVYFKDIHPPAGIRETWAALHARKLPWRESYRKFARIELPAAPGTSAASLMAARRPLGLGLEIVVSGTTPIAVGQPLAFQVLRDGKPLPGLAVELVSERNPMGIWGQTDANGQLRHTLPFSGRWLLRATELRPAARSPEAWESRFVTLAVEAG